MYAQQTETPQTERRVALAWLRSLLGVGATLLWLGALALLPMRDSAATAEPIDAYSKRSHLSLSGDWTLAPVANPDFTPQPIHVPGDIPIVGGVLRWSRRFDLDVASAPVVAWLDIGGVANHGIVRLNGSLVGTLEPFTRTRLDVRGALVTRGANVLEIELDDRQLSTTVPGAAVEPLVATLGALAYTLVGPWEPRNGIVREISLDYSSAPIIADVFATPILGDVDRLDLRIRVSGPVTHQMQLAVGLLHAGQLLSAVPALRNANGEFEARISLPGATRWSPDNPYLYELIVSLTDGAPLDAVLERVAFRSIEARGNRFRLNGAPLFLRGITRHDIYPGGSFVVKPEMLLDDLQRMKALGVNFVRTIHYPPDEQLLRYADRLGLLVSEEIPAWARIADPAVVSVARTMLTALVERDYNHPCVIAWLTGTGADHAAIGSYFAAVAPAVRAIDATRPLSYTFDDSASTPAAITRNLDIVASAGMDFLAQAGYWDAASVAAIAATLPLDRPVLVAEWTGSEGSNRGPVGAPGFTGVRVGAGDPDGTGVMSEVFQAQALAQSFEPWLQPLLAGSPPIAGLTYFNWQDVGWSGTPFLFNGHHAALRNGLVYEDRAPKLAFHVFGLVMNALRQVNPGP